MPTTGANKLELALVTEEAKLMSHDDPTNERLGSYSTGMVEEDDDNP
jgi:hypothetical protein